MQPAIRICDLSKTFGTGSRTIKALDQVNLDIDRGEMVALIGASGSGKSTLIRHLSGLTCGDRGDSACSVEVLGCSVQAGGVLTGNARRVRARIGVVFQQFNLIGRLSLLTNVTLGFLGRIPRWRGWLGWFTQAEKQASMDALHRVGIGSYAKQRASTLSGGQQQRAAIARALVQRAEVILADEPIASLDPESARSVMENLARVNREDGITVVVSLHQVDFATRFCPRTIAMRDGRIIYDGFSSALTPSLLRELYGATGEKLVKPRPVAIPGFDFNYDPREEAAVAAV